MTTSRATIRDDLLARIESLVLAGAISDEAAAEYVAEVRMEADRKVAGRWQPYPWQHPHTHPEGWTGGCDQTCFLRPRATIPVQGMWLQLGGRGTGKTEGAARYVDAHVNGPACDSRIPGGHLMVMVAPTQGDGVKAITGPSGLRTVNPSTKLVGSYGGLTVRWTSGTGAGTRMAVLGAHTPDDVERLRAAGNTCLVWFEEIAAQRQLAAARHHTSLGLRIGAHPHFVGSTTPKPRAEIKELLADPDTISTRGRTQDAHHLDPAVRAVYERRYGGTRLGRQELGGEVLDDVEGALWIHDTRVADRDPKDDRPGIEDTRLTPGAIGWTSHRPEAATLIAAQYVHRALVAVDPPGGTTEAGIIVCGTIGGHGYVLADLSGEMGPNAWAQRAIDAYYDFGCEGIGIEKAYGGDMVTNTIQTLDNTVPLFPVPTKVGKRLRAEPVQALYQQGRIHHVGSFVELEDQMTGWVPDETPESPDRLDALVHALTFLLVRASEGSVPRAPQRTIRRQTRRA